MLPLQQAMAIPPQYDYSNESGCIDDVSQLYYSASEEPRF